MGSRQGRAQASVGESRELCIIVGDQAALQAVHREWVEKGIPIALAPTKISHEVDGSLTCQSIVTG